MSDPSLPLRGHITRVIRSLCLFSATLSLAACYAVNASSAEKIVGKNESRTVVHFESDQAMSTFVHAVRHRYAHESNLGPSHFSIPFIINVNDAQRVLSRNAFYNRQVDIADLNGDGTISNTEAKIYAGDDAAH